MKFTRRALTVGLTTAALLAASFPAVAQAAPPVTEAAAVAPTVVNLFNINDFHGRIDANTVKWAGTVEGLRASAGESNSLFLAAGDNVSASLFASASQNDQPTIDVLNALGLNASSDGNHEFDKGYDDLINRIIGNPRNAEWDYLGANVYLKGTSTPAQQEYSIFTVDGIKIGVIGAVTAETPSLVSPGGITQIDIGDPVAAVNRVADQLTDGNTANGEADVLVAEYHEGATVGSDVGGTLASNLAINGPFTSIVNNTSAKVSVLFTGHTHQLYAWDAPVPGQAGVTRPVLQTGSYGSNIGDVALSIDPTTKKVLSYTAKNVPRVTTDDATLVATYPRVAQVKTITDAALAQAAVIGNKVVGHVGADITTAYLNGTRDDRGSESTLGNLVANALRDGLSSADRGGAQIGVVNPGGLRAELLYGTDGSVTYAQANAVLPFVNNLWTLSLTGAQFKAVLEQMWQPATASRPFLDLGLSDNVSYTIDPAAAAGSHITSITVDGKPIDPSASYRIGTFSFLGTGGDNFTEFTKATDVKDTGLLDRDVWIDYLTAKSPVDPSFARRGVVVTGLPGDVTAGSPVSFGVSKLDLTSLGSPANASVTATIDGQNVGTYPVTSGAATIAFTVPDRLVGAKTLTLVASPSKTTVTIALNVAKKPTAKGTVVLDPATVRAGGTVDVKLAAWDPATKLAVTLDGKKVKSVITDQKGAATVQLNLSRGVKVGAHRVTATTPDAVSTSATLTVTRFCVPYPGKKAAPGPYLQWLIAVILGHAC
ncbi:2',3'-cyclic-nucleotide 2'-phosphodiesterase/5'-or 3'-nucleotidase, 5'-nucleotidase family [Nakamurella panacisegetis]|uniref:2',3'-cyclic-nucleotide 2'-phosphodiesterase/5'-or 3'-nucleotidase, 5'-nucleotidase family n=1 Tax=Nakamurella panacisegetis TaxID=1090615 RepID=A0A1H0LX00_9ACTN|nr:5'-nucleotidase C-terminal domain-containing protein [Nakamurella panacisegetis]SDO72571.1 2',3'-cyclic-nucleotide 2'-phosphodiesterase/5'-or 3'-nucleotidase, 5'-nucleotidase family [Nakamurella panacisegetis]